MPDGDAPSGPPVVRAAVGRILRGTEPDYSPVRGPFPPTRLELQMAINRERFAADAKYPLRENAVLSSEQLSAARAQLGGAAPVVRKALSGASPLTAAQLREARAAAGYGVAAVAPTDADELSADS